MSIVFAVRGKGGTQEQADFEYMMVNTGKAGNISFTPGVAVSLGIHGGDFVKVGYDTKKKLLYLGKASEVDGFKVRSVGPTSRMYMFASSGFKRMLQNAGMLDCITGIRLPLDNAETKGKLLAFRYDEEES